MPLRLVFMGTPDFAVPTLVELVGRGHDVAAVYTRAPKPAGRGMELSPSPIEREARRFGIPVLTPKTLRTPEAEEHFRAHAADAAVVVAYGLILPTSILDAPRLGCFNLHASALPRWRGAAPINRAIMAGDAESGVTIMQMDEGLDTGAILIAERVPIGPKTTAGALHDALAALGSRLIVAALDGLAAGTLTPRPQPGEGITYAAKLRRDEGRLDWRRPASELERATRALNPWPGTWLEAAGERIKVLEAECSPGVAGAVPGTVLDDRLRIACSQGALGPTMLQRSGRGPADTASFLRGFAIRPGDILPCPATS
jgi:methionyl-tRNA formyltransferase